MGLITAEEITNYYLYGSAKKPNDISDSRIADRPKSFTTNISVDINDYMDNGPGRFASPAFFEVIKLFFSSLTSLPPNTYTESQLRQLLGTNEAYIKLQQWAYDDGVNDYAERVYIWNTVAFEIADDARFVVDTNGDRYIEKFSVIPYSNSGVENFDFQSDDWLAIIGNGNFLEERVDPSGIGRTVNIAFDGQRARTRYDFSSYQYDISTATTPNPLLLTDLYFEIPDLTDNLFGTKDAPIRFLEDGKPIYYGTDGDDVIEGIVHHKTGVDFSNQRYLGDFVPNGMHYVVGNGGDHIMATDGNDVLEGGEGNDILQGNFGDDKLYGDVGDDKLSGGTGADYMEGGEGDDTYIAGDGDTILDTDGFGRVLFDDIALDGGINYSDQSTYGWKAGPLISQSTRPAGYSK